MIDHLWQNWDAKYSLNYVVSVTTVIYTTISTVKVCRNFHQKNGLQVPVCYQWKARYHQDIKKTKHNFKWLSIIWFRLSKNTVQLKQTIINLPSAKNSPGGAWPKNKNKTALIGHTDCHICRQKGNNQFDTNYIWQASLINTQYLMKIANDNMISSKLTMPADSIHNFQQLHQSPMIIETYTKGLSWHFDYHCIPKQ